MSQPQSEDPDPLLAYFIEGPAAATPRVPEEPGAQATVEADLSPPLSEPSPTMQSDTARVDRVERELDQSRRALLLLTSEVATLVGSIADMNARLGRPQPRTLLIRTSLPRHWQRGVLAFAALLIVLNAGVISWRYRPGAWTTGPTAGQQVQAAAPIAAVPEPVPAIPSAIVPDAQPAVALKRVSAPAVARVNYVGTLSIDSSPGGNVFIDRKAAGRTPLRAANLRAGSHLVWIEREGYRRWTRVVPVSADRVSRVSAELERVASK